VAIARSDASTTAFARTELRSALAAAWPNADHRVTRELSRLRCALGDEAIINPLLAVMEADTGERDASGAGYFARNPKYGQAIRDMLEAAPLLERMHHAQMLLWLADRWTTEQRRRWFTAVADAQAHSKGGHDYASLWERIRDTALRYTPDSEKAAVAAISVARSADEAAAVPPPEGPGREWSLEEATRVASGPLAARNFSRGKNLYAAAGCHACHRIGGAGSAIGPDLSGLGQRFTVRDILEAIVEPSRTISDQYRMLLVQTTDGRTYSGRVISRDETTVHLATNLLRPGQSEAIPSAAIASTQVMPVSTMPSGLLNPLNETEVLDLLAYLVSGGDETHRVFQPAP
jgi:putative heme-binding domain-containing protein